MRRLALLLSAALLGTGCVVTADDCDRTATITWDFTDADGNFFTTCGQAGVNFVDVYVGSEGFRFSCVDASTGVVGLPGGTPWITVEGVSAASFSDPGQIIYRDIVQAASVCGDQLVDAHAAEQEVWIQPVYSACAAVPSYVWFSVIDDSTGAAVWGVDAASSIANKRLYTCQADAIRTVLPAGPYTLDWIEERVEGPTTVFSVTRANCAGTPIDVLGEYFGNGVVEVPVSLATSTAACQ
jgi:hypothetical protein